MLSIRLHAQIVYTCFGLVRAEYTICVLRNIIAIIHTRTDMDVFHVVAIIHRGNLVLEEFPARAALRAMARQRRRQARGRTGKRLTSKKCQSRR